ncbi:hypothetical protein AVEN_96675-1 [Araneus ventricosus]|uniref:Uncharacterized protein n=1 Tax=Araneus ventricosus TaxID=182803 RepID=A0A4Y2E7F9_ARAVE|nr:hypothetical protein AVEN_96675-1 [Araneus ventricosus]
MSLSGQTWPKKVRILFGSNISLKAATGEMECTGSWMQRWAARMKISTPQNLRGITPDPYILWIFCKNLTMVGPGEERDSDRREIPLFQPITEDSVMLCILKNYYTSKVRYAHQGLRSF